MRCCFAFLALLISFAPLPAQESLIDPAKGTVDDKGMVWYDFRLLDVEGQGWKETKAPYDRLPPTAEGKVPASVWGLSRHSTGICGRFVTDAGGIQVKWKLTSPNLAMPHMPATGVSGVDLYVRKSPEQWHWLGTGRPTAQANQAIFPAVPGKHEYLLYLPLYNGTMSLEIGLPKAAALAQGPVRPSERRKPIVFYGTSITQGGCASRPGMVHTAILGRRLDYPVINLGFSGSGRMDDAVVELMAQLDPALYVIDCLPNMNAALITERTGPLVKTLRQATPQAHILLVEDRTYANAQVLANVLKTNVSNRAAFKKEYDKLVAEGVKGLSYLPGDALIGDDGEGTVDGSHPTDLGFLRQAEVFLQAMRPILSGEKRK